LRRRADIPRPRTDREQILCLSSFKLLWTSPGDN
jgi:hypothetical protein